MGIALFDTHADTAYEMYKRKKGLRNNGLHVSLDYTREYDEYTEVFAIWSDKSLSDGACYEQFFKIENNLRKLCNEESDVAIADCYDDIVRARESNKTALLLAVEDARLLSSKLSRLDELREHGVRLLTMQWQGETIIGGGFDTDLPLKPFGAEVCRRCAQLGIIPDISHASERTAREIIEICAQLGAPVIASHSNSFSVCAHKRNLSDANFSHLCDAGGIVGISLAPQHLRLSGVATSEDVFSHIDHYAQTRGIEYVCLGCDFDGIETTPADIRDLRYLPLIAEQMLKRNYKEEDVLSVFSKNAERFFSLNLK